MKKKSIDTSWKGSISAASIALGIPAEHIQACKDLDCPHAQGRYYLKEIKEWYEKNKEAVIEYCNDDRAGSNGNGLAFEKERKERALASIAEIELKERQFQSLDRDKVLSTLKRIFESQSIILSNMSQVLPIKLEDKKAPFIQIELDKSYEDFRNLLIDEINRCKKQK